MIRSWVIFLVTSHISLSFALWALIRLVFYQVLTHAVLHPNSGIWTSTRTSLICEFLLIHLISTWRSSSRETSSELCLLPTICLIFIVCIIVDLHLVVWWFDFSFPSQEYRLRWEQSPTVSFHGERLANDYQTKRWRWVICLKSYTSLVVQPRFQFKLLAIEREIKERWVLVCFCVLERI